MNSPYKSVKVADPFPYKNFAFPAILLSIFTHINNLQALLQLLIFGLYRLHKSFKVHQRAVNTTSISNRFPGIGSAITQL
jgi:hypothetical protein